MDAVAQSRARPGFAAWIYVGLLTVVLGVAVVAPILLRPPDLTWSLWLGFVLGQAPLAAAAAFHIRHPGAWRSAPMIAVGFVGLAGTAVLGAIGGLMLAIADLRQDSGALATANNLALVEVLPFVVGSLFLWAGLRRARRKPAPTGQRWLIWILRAIVGIEMAAVVAVGAFAVLDGGWSGLALGLLIVLIVGSFALSQGLVAIALVRGALAGERPTLAWWLGGVAWTIEVIGLPVAIALPGVGGPVFLASPVCLIAAFALGLPELGEEAASVG